MKKLSLIIAMLLICTSCSNGNSSTSLENTSENSSTSTSETTAQTTAQTTTQTTSTTESTPPNTDDTEDIALDISRFDTEKPVIALTFDDGPNTNTTVKVLEKLEKYDIVATFFVIGININENSGEIMKQAVDMGCEIGNHSNTHANLSKLTFDEVMEELNTTADLVKKYTGKTPKVFRPPFIAINQEMYDKIEMPVIAGIGAEDWKPEINAEKRAEMIISQVKDGTFILLHDMNGNQQTVDALDIIIPTLLDQGYQFATVSELFAVKKVTPQKNVLYGNVLQEGKWA